jgi:hypothetical protein
MMPVEIWEEERRERCERWEWRDHVGEREKGRREVGWFLAGVDGAQGDRLYRKPS